MKRLCLSQLLRFVGIVLLVPVALHAQTTTPLTRVPATTLRLPASLPLPSYTFAAGYGNLRVTQPVALVTPPSETRRLFIVEKTGRIRLIPDVTAATPTSTVFLDLAARIATSTSTSDERGLLALAFHPAFATNGQFYVWYTLNTTTAAGTGLHDRLSRFKISSTNANLADPASEEPLLTQRDEHNNHNGGDLHFGPDGYLYLSLGDEGGANDEYQNSQRIDRDLFSGILRLDVDRLPGSLQPNAHSAVHAGAYAIPPDNPWVGATAFNGTAVDPTAVRTEFWAVGLRNPWRMAFDRVTGQLWCGDVGQDAREEINLIVRGGNYGWGFREGTIASPRTSPPAAANFLPPVWDYGTTEGTSVIGGFVYRGALHPELSGTYLFADYVSGRIWSLLPAGTTPVSASRIRLLARAGNGGISSLGVDPATGAILVTFLGSGEIIRLVATTTATDPVPATLSATGLFSNLATLTPAPGVVPYEPIVAAWSDHATVRRWFAVTSATGIFGRGAAPEDRWSYPNSTVWVQHLDLALTRGDPSTTRRVETRILMGGPGNYALSYRWNAEQTDATLVPDPGDDRDFTVIENGTARRQTWHYPSRAECHSCHSNNAGFVLGFNTLQLDRPYVFPGGSANLLTALAQSGYLASTPAPVPSAQPTLAAPTDPTQSLERRARSYLHVNCSPCHDSGSSALSGWTTLAFGSLANTGLIEGTLRDDRGDPANRALVPGDPLHSQILQRMSADDGGRMPAFGLRERDLAGENLLTQWIASLNAPLDVTTPGRLANLASRAQIDAANPLIAGFVISPGFRKRVLIRATGPALALDPFNLTDTVDDPQIRLYGPNSAQTLLTTNDNWASTSASTFSRVGAFPLAVGSRDAAIDILLSGGSYTAVITDAANRPGLALVEIYDADPVNIAASTSFPRLINTSIRAQVGTGASVLIPGLVVGSGAPKTLLVRAIGPTLAARPFNVPGTLARPVVTVFSGSQVVATNTAWHTARNAAEIRAATPRVGAFALPEGSADSALLLALAPGPYTIQVSGAENTTGAVLVEVYELP